MRHRRGRTHTEGCHMVSGHGAHKPWGGANDKTLFCCIARENSPINFGLIAYKHGRQAAQSLFPEIPGWALPCLLPREVGYMAGSGAASARGWQPAKTTVWCQGYGYIKGGKWAHYSQTSFLTSRLWSGAPLHLCSNRALAPNTFQALSFHHAGTLPSPRI